MDQTILESIRNYIQILEYKSKYYENIRYCIRHFFNLLIDSLSQPGPAEIMAVTVPNPWRHGCCASNKRLSFKSNYCEMKIRRGHQVTFHKDERLSRLTDETPE